MGRNLPPLNALRVFETAARAESFTAAASELNITHGAVSRQIKSLEERLGQQLFLRQGRRSVATDHARAFALEIGALFDRMGDATLRFGKSPRKRVVRVNAQTTLAMRWLIPRLPEFYALHPDIEVVLATASSADPGFGGSFDVAIRRDPGATPGFRQFAKTPLFSEWRTVIAAPSLLEQKPLHRPSALARHTFIATATRAGDWDAWLDAAGRGSLRPANVLRFDHFHVSLQAIVDGLGVGIGTLPTLSRDLLQGRLTLPFPEVRVAGADYVALLPAAAERSHQLHEFLAWLTMVAAVPSSA
ncbi:LysR substrate-binding domain-containing protein [Variovorax sp. NFACC27]|uniref:LysR substrate-binding domain-containing protein n=1 Tax=unclassified Variovorax TaxID=663243 RepID=UPI000894C173|nr:DNA-binding transcriptional regulator, LysR family [Variovorax sp. NFACC28]SEG70253.1 DNA-binding transcriptional regulator, LysR family [Variovorax sp. NFACC29]SFC82976.1 DNA-binding transcriptional regulator, LysR family [Variovorax sp. NFACC26]SFF98143.1 DNA-binding transcriptional regulator, LysR family [Variovorax sp. NFACC27]